MIKEFREFVTRGNVFDLAVGIMIGGAFGKIVDSLVKDVLMPPIGLLLGSVDFSNLFINMSRTPYATLAEAQAAGAATINYGVFLNQVISFLIVAFSIFILLKQINRLRRPGAPPAPTEKKCEFCQTNIPLAAIRCPHCTSSLQPA